jgi:hypothetical protein
VTAYRSQRDHRFEHASDAILHIETVNCAWGCRRGAETAEELLEFGPGGTCGILAAVAAGTGEPVPELDDDGSQIECLVREPVRS